MHRNATSGRFVAQIDVATVGEKGTLVEAGLCRVDSAMPMEAVMPDASSCDLVEGGPGI